MSGRKTDRLDRMRKMLMTENGITIREFAGKLDVSEITVRRDLKLLEKQGCLRLVNGVAIYHAAEKTALYPEYNLNDECLVFPQKKERIGRRAASLIEANDVVAIDSGSTAAYLARALPYDIHMTVLASSFNVLLDLNDHYNCDIICSGGYLYSNTKTFYCPEGISMINRTCINKTFITADGISEKMNVTCIAPHEMDLKRALMESGQTKILLADSSKFGRIFPTAFSHLKDFDSIITDDELSDEWRSLIESQGIHLYCE